MILKKKEFKKKHDFEEEIIFKKHDFEENFFEKHDVELNFFRPVRFWFKIFSFGQIMN